jgi:hypothetical protein
MVTVWQAAMLAVGGNLERFLPVVGYTLLFVGAILAGALVIAWLDRWRKRPQNPGMSTNDQLAHFRTLYERGQLSPEEFARIRTLLGERLRQEMEVPAAPPPAGPTSPAPAEQEADIVVDPEPPPPGPPTPGSPAA